MNEHRYAILIASSQFPEEPKLQPLRCPENDVDGLNAVLKLGSRGEFTETFVVKNRPHYEILLKINQVLQSAAKDDLVFIYYSGHGKLDLAGRLYLVTNNTVMNSLQATSIPVQNLWDNIEVSACRRVILVLDCCYSGAVEKVFSRGSVDDQIGIGQRAQGTFIMTASTGIQVAEEKESDRYAMFTKHIIGGLESGEADLDGDGQISVAELYDYVHAQVRDEGCQEPMKWDLNVRGELILSQSGKTPPPVRRDQIRDLLLNLAKEGIIPDSILSKAWKINAMKPPELQGDLKNYDELLGQLLQQKIRRGEFIEAWYHLEQTSPPAPVKDLSVEPARESVTQSRPPPASQGVTNPNPQSLERQSSNVILPVFSRSISRASGILLLATGLLSSIPTLNGFFLYDPYFILLLPLAFLNVFFGATLFLKKEWAIRGGIFASMTSLSIDALSPGGFGILPVFGVFRLFIMFSMFAVFLLSHALKNVGDGVETKLRLPLRKRLPPSALLIVSGLFFTLFAFLATPYDLGYYTFYLLYGYYTFYSVYVLVIVVTGLLQAASGVALLFDVSWGSKVAIIASLVGLGIIPALAIDVFGILPIIAFLILLKPSFRAPRIVKLG